MSIDIENKPSNKICINDQVKRFKKKRNQGSFTVCVCAERI
jgi:hypothetical protein